MNIIWSAQARGDLRAIRNFIARDSEHYASCRLSVCSSASNKRRACHPKVTLFMNSSSPTCGKSTKAATESSTAFRMSSFKW